LLRRLEGLGAETRMRVRLWVERRALSASVLFYRIPRVVLAPNAEWVNLLEWRTGKPVFPMTRGVDTTMVSPDKRTRTDPVVNIGYVGRLSVEKNVRALAALESALLAESPDGFHFTIVGDGGEREWLGARMRRAVFTGVLRGEELAAAYANMDLF